MAAQILAGLAIVAALITFVAIDSKGTYQFITFYSMIVSNILGLQYSFLLIENYSFFRRARKIIFSLRSRNHSTYRIPFFRSSWPCKMEKCPMGSRTRVCIRIISSSVGRKFWVITNSPAGTILCTYWLRGVFLSYIYLFRLETQYSNVWEIKLQPSWVIPMQVPVLFMDH